MSKTLKDEGITAKSDLYMKVKHMKTPLTLDQVTEELLFQQVQQSIVKEVYPCNEKSATYLASLEIQSIFGDFNKKKHRVGYLKYVPANNSMYKLNIF